MTHATRVTTVLFLLLFAVTACSDDHGVDDEGGLLPGDDDDPALEATYDLSILPDLDPGFVSTEMVDDREVSFLRTEFAIVFEQQATVGQVNDTLRAFDARIVDMVPRHLDLIVEVEDPGNMEAVAALADDIEAVDHVVEVLKSDLISVPEDEESRGQPLLPEGFEDGSGGLERLDHIEHHLAVRAHAAWNARSAIVDEDDRPWLVVSDMFGDGAPGDVFNVDVQDSSDFAEVDDWNLGDQNRHGYHVLGIAAGAFEPLSNESQSRDDVTGLFPESLRLRAVDMERKATALRYVNRSGARIKDILEEDSDARVVLVTSIGEWAPLANLRARSWTRTVRDDQTVVGSGMEGDFIHFTSAGNAKPTNGGYDRWDAQDNGPFTYAALGEMTTKNPLGSTYPNLTNIHVVENRRNSSDEPPLPACISESSIVGGTLSAIGSSVHSIGECSEYDDDGSCDDYTGQDGAGDASGTSMAAPQAAGLAAYMWSINPDLSVTELRALIEETAYFSTAMQNRGSDCHSTHGEPVIDALAAVLAAGGDDVRRAILDVHDLGVFDAADISAVKVAFDGASGDEEYSRYDLSGDGLVGSGADGEVRFDLDGSLEYGVVQQSIPEPVGADQILDYDEGAVSDWDILCYYAYSDLFTGSEAARDHLISDRCTGAVAQLTVYDGLGAPLEGVPLEVTQAGGSVLHHVEDLGDGEYRIWVRESDENHEIEVPSGYAISGDTSLPEPDRYQLFGDRLITLDQTPDASIELTAPRQITTFREMAELTVEALVTSPSDSATVSVEVDGTVGASQEISESGEQQVELGVDGLCPPGEGVEVSVGLVDGFGNEDSDSVEITVLERPLTASMAGAGAIEIAWEDPAFVGGDPQWYVPDQTLEGVADKTTCEYPQSEQLDQEELQWWIPDPWQGDLVQHGTSYDVDDAFFRSEGQHVERSIGLAYEYQDEVAQIQRSLRPCYGELHITESINPEQAFGTVLETVVMEYPDGPVPDDDYPPCEEYRSTAGSFGIDQDILLEFEQIQTQLEAEALLGELFDDLLIELEPDEPFPGEPDALIETAGVVWGDELRDHVFHGLSGALHNGSFPDYHDDLVDLTADASQALDVVDFAFFMMVAREVTHHARLFGSTAGGGANGWKHLGFAENADTLVEEERVNPLAPARGALAGFAQAAFITAEYEDYDQATVKASVEAGVYGSLSKAIEAVGFATN